MSYPPLKNRFSFIDLFDCSSFLHYMQRRDKPFLCSTEKNRLLSLVEFIYQTNYLLFAFYFHYDDEFPLCLCFLSHCRLHALSLSDFRVTFPPSHAHFVDLSLVHCSQILFHINPKESHRKKVDTARCSWVWTPLAKLSIGPTQALLPSTHIHLRSEMII